MYTNPESLKEVHELIKEALERAGRESSGGTPEMQAQGIAFHFQTAIDNTRTQFSEALYKVDLAMQGYDDSTMRAMYEMQDLHGNTNPKTMSDDELRQRYVQKTVDGYKVYDSNYQMWIAMSASSEISIEMMISDDLGGTPIARIRAYDPETGTRVDYEDWQITQHDIRGSYLNEWNSAPQEWREMHYEDALYGMAKTGIGGAGKVSGATSSFMMANHYRASNNLFSGNLSNYYKGWSGEWVPIRNVHPDAGRSFVQWGKDIGEISAKAKGKTAGAKWKTGGRVCIALSVTFSLVDIGRTQYYDDSNKHEVAWKKSFDIAFALTGFIPGVGWAISGTYFLLDAGGAFGNWGKASGFSRSEVDSWIARDRATTQQELCSMDFEIEYVAPIEQIRMEMIRESREFARDNTNVAPRAIYSTKRF